MNKTIWQGFNTHTQNTLGFHLTITHVSLRDSNGAVLVYDITDEDSFQKVKNWVKELRKMLGQEITLCIVGNKIDREKDRNVSQAEADE